MCSGEHDVDYMVHASLCQVCGGLTIGGNTECVGGQFGDCENVISILQAETIAARVRVVAGDTRK
jgi:hypothetical protein